VIQKKICLLGGFGVGKTSLVSQFVHSIFSEKYLTTIGVKIDKKSVPVDRTQVELVIWDIYGHDDYQKLRLSYLRGASGYLLVADGTRQATLETVDELQRLTEDTIGRVPFVLAVNKADLRAQWQIDTGAIEERRRAGWHVVETSAKTGDMVEGAFATLAREMLTFTSHDRHD
jgi:small GTP-binding protein